jgi:hypothetical protein
MKSYTEHLQIVNTFELGETIAAAQFLIENGLTHPNFKGFELREKQTNFI